MPSVVDKASQFSLQQSRYALTPRYFPGKKRLTKFCNQFNFTSFIQPRRLVHQRPDMPRQASEEQVIITRNKRSSASPETPENRQPRSKPSSGGPHKSRAIKDQENGQGRRGSPASASQSGRANLSATRIRAEAVDKCAKLLNVPLPTGGERQAADLNQSDVKPTSPSAAYLDYCINKEIRRRKRAIVDNLMAAISECIEQRLEALEGECGHTSGSQSSSRTFQAGKQLSRAAGQKRSKGQSSRDESENEEEGNDDFRRKKDNKRTKTTKDDTRLRFACPYHQHDPKRFGRERTCLGPGWMDISRLKEHLERRHSLSSYQCNRCLRRFDEENELKEHQREEIPCPVKEPGSVQRDLSDGYDEEQSKKLKARLRISPVEKWRVWYSILFNVRADSPEIPSPYYDPSLSSAKIPSIKLENPEEWREYLNKARPAIEQQVILAVDEAFGNRESQLKSDVMERLQELPRIIADQLQFPGLSSEETSTVADNLGLFTFDLDFLNQQEYEDGSFDFYTLNNGPVLDNPSALEIAESPDSSDAYQAGESSATSLGDDTTYQQFNYKPGMMAASLDFSLPGNGHY
ncbi:hypothetical protein FHETE_4272 [Fusarium heterosporum]|uniref:C2H2-type domain-containing protein n=1 Tax=Fusarium heterosporum TaxID=42747 RepID=A0A8H5TJL5_FUSHE|nr:hypothetical protein FHETE_4272 [Fusarium heterosporum]